MGNLFCKASKKDLSIEDTYTPYVVNPQEQVSPVIPAPISDNPVTRPTLKTAKSKEVEATAEVHRVSLDETAPSVSIQTKSIEAIALPTGEHTISPTLPAEVSSITGLSGNTTIRFTTDADSRKDGTSNIIPGVDTQLPVKDSPSSSFPQCDEILLAPISPTIHLPPQPENNPKPSSFRSTSQHPDLDFENLAKSAQEEDYNRLKLNFIKSPNDFLVQNLTMSVQFLENFEKDKDNLRNLKKDTEEQFNAACAPSKQHVIVGHHLFHKVLDNVGFLSLDDSGKSTLEPIQPTQYFVSNECIEAHRKEDFVNGSMEYSNLDQPHYRATVEESNHPGYFKLKFMDGMESLLPETTSTTPGNPLSTTDSPPPIPRLLTPLGEEEGAPAERVSTPIGEARKFSFNKAPVLKSEGATIAEEDEDDEFQTGEEFMRNLGMRLQVQSSPGYKSHVPFKPVSPRDGKIMRQGDRMNEVMPRDLPMNRKVRPPKAPKKSGKIKAEEPPPEPRRPEGPLVSETLIEEDQYGYATSTPRDLMHYINSSEGQMFFRKNALPIKCFKKVKVQSEEDLEDTVVFGISPLAKMEEFEFIDSKNVNRVFADRFPSLANQIGKERLLNGSMHKDEKILCREERPLSSKFAKEDQFQFIPTTEIGFWPEEGLEFYLRESSKLKDKRTGMIYEWPPKEVTRQAQQIFIRRMKKQLGHDKLSNFFLYKQNMFDSIPRREKERSKQILFQIQENMGIFMMVCINRLRADKGFYPMPDMNRLHNILVCEETLRLINPSLAIDRGRDINAFARAKEEKELKSTDRVQNFLRNRLRAEEERKQDQSSESDADKTFLHPNDPKVSSFQLKNFDSLRGGLVLGFFLEHFIKMAEKSNQYRCYGQGLMYLMHCENLVRLIKELNCHAANESEIREKIEQLKQVCRGNGLDYWRINIGVTDNFTRGSSFRAMSSNPDPHQRIPLPDVPKKASPLPGVKLPSSKVL
eukprot:maker-scaffold462_size163801-snap-gene-0.53 protein:Tk04579 transcript:maker-scaffold462_size163801-snap-gene-0.53-mRNA-1 annotation:"hypothetical protein AaeL_AAEL009477"